jgi:hypothetical protein
VVVPVCHPLGALALAVPGLQPGRQGACASCPALDALGQHWWAPWQWGLDRRDAWLLANPRASVAVAACMAWMCSGLRLCLIPRYKHAFLAWAVVLLPCLGVWVCGLPCVCGVESTTGRCVRITGEETR